MTSACADEGPVHPRIDNAWLTRWTAKRALLPGSGRTSQRACRRTVSSVWVCTAAPCTPGCIWTASVTPEPRGLRRRGSRRGLRALTAATAGVPRSPWGVVFHADGFLESPRVSRRQGLVNALIPQSGDGDGHYGFDHDAEMTSRIYRDGELIDEYDGPGTYASDQPDAEATYRVEQTVKGPGYAGLATERSLPFTCRSAKPTTDEWTALPGSSCRCGGHEPP